MAEKVAAEKAGESSKRRKVSLAHAGGGDAVYQRQLV